MTPALPRADCEPKLPHPMGSKIKVAVLGTGSLGKEHARIYAELARAGHIELAGVYDVAAEMAERIAQRYSTRRFGSFPEAMAEAEAFSVATPTNTHHELARQ